MSRIWWALGAVSEAEPVGEGADLGPALRTGHAAAGGEVSGVRLILLPVAHVLVPQRQRAASALAAPGAVEEPQAGGEVLQRPRSSVQGLVGSTSPAAVRRRSASAWDRPAE
ncbi:hypothetical protein [Streptomyces nigrescens]